jgi:hypothetical protein
MKKLKLNLNELRICSRVREPLIRTINLFIYVIFSKFIFDIDKEKKWAELERIVVNYARKDLALRNKLTEIKYI